jgi:hypothetical protein
MVIARRPRWRVITFIAAPAQGHGRGFCDDCTLVAHLVRDEGVGSSNLPTPTNEINHLAIWAFARCTDWCTEIKRPHPDQPSGAVSLGGEACFGIIAVG